MKEMKGNRIVAGIVGLAVCVILVGSLLAPVISDAQDDQEVVYNNVVSIGNFSRIVDPDSVDMVIVWDTETQILTVDGSAITIGRIANTMFVSDQGMIRFDKATGTSSMYLKGQDSVTLTLVGTVTATIASGVITVACGEDNYTITPTEWLFIPNEEGKYRLYRNYDPTRTLYVNNIDDIYFCQSIGTLGLVSGHGGSCTLWDREGAPSYDMTYTIERVQGYTDLYEFSPSSYAISAEAGTKPDLTLFAPYITMLPVEITAHTDVNSSIIGLLGAIPVVIIAAIIIYVVRPVLMGRD